MNTPALSLPQAANTLLTGQRKPAAGL